jgi:hypothetical protein
MKAGKGRRRTGSHDMIFEGPPLLSNPYSRTTLTPQQLQPLVVFLQQLHPSPNLSGQGRLRLFLVAFLLFAPFPVSSLLLRLFSLSPYTVLGLVILVFILVVDATANLGRAVSSDRRTVIVRMGGEGRVWGSGTGKTRSFR